MIDSYKHKGQRINLVDELKKKGINDNNVISAMLNVPRHLFMDKTLELHAYKDQALPIAAGQTISQPYTVAFQSQLLEINKNDKVLEVGTGSGYQAAILCEMGAKVYSIERQKELYSNTNLLLQKLNYKINCFYGDGYLGLPTYGPFDKIIITAGAPSVPIALIEQLKIGGIFVAPIGCAENQIMTLIKKHESGLEKKEYGNFLFVPMLKGKV